MFRPLILIMFCAGIALSTGACGADSYAAPKRSAQPAHVEVVDAGAPATADERGPVAPGSGEAAVLGVGPDELGSWYIWTMSGKRQLEVAQDVHMCSPKTGECRDLGPEMCLRTVQTQVCEYDSLEGDPVRCHPVTLTVGQPVTVAVTSPYAGVEMVTGACLDAVRSAEPIGPGEQTWRFPRRDHPRGWIEDMASCGGSPHPDCAQWFVRPVGGPV